MNRLVNESSLYLKQHANNPVDWYPWGPEALQKAKDLDRPIFLSIGYSACHWCHVMEHESFEDPATAQILNDHFICIKVDREERPDLDAIYMSALQVMSREGGGWPLSVWLTPDLHPYYAGTYFPPDNRYAPHRPSFRALLVALIDAWLNRRSEIKEKSGEITKFLSQMDPSGGEGELSAELLQKSAQALQRGFDPMHGGFGRAPKFPHSLELRLLLRVWKRFQAQESLHVIRLTLDKMAMGGMYDQIGGGFHRYSTDAKWLVPHFEKMLYDNALLTWSYLEAWQATKESFYKEVVEETLNYVLQEMTSPAGAFYSTQDADSEGEEGKFYVWSRAEIEQVLGVQEANLFNYVYDVSEGGNFEGHNILNRPKTWEQVGRMFNLPEQEIRQRIESAKLKLYEVRSKRVWPGRDEKILTAWNGLMIAALAQSGSVFEEPKYIEAAKKASQFVLEKMRFADGKLYRTCGIDSPAKLNGYSEDYAFFIDGLLHLYEATFETKWLKQATELADIMIDQFADLEGGFFYTGKDHESLIVRNKDTHDGSTPSGNSMTVTVLLRLATFTDRNQYRELAGKTLRRFHEVMSESPGGCGQMLTALDYYLGPVHEFVVIGLQKDADTQQVLRAIRQRFLPNKVVVFLDPSQREAESKLVSLITDRKMVDGKVTTYICQNQICQAPIVGVEGIDEALSRL